MEPITVTNWQSGNAGFECQEAENYTGIKYVYSYKIDSWSSSILGDFIASFPDGHTNTITISNNNGTYFNWSAIIPIGAVIVKGGTSANIFKYDPEAYGDQVLSAPINPNNNKPYGVSHVTFCWDPPQEKCFDIQTGWAYGNRYVQKGNWATWVPYDGTAKTVDLLAGKNYKAGTVSFSAPVDGYVTITINLNQGVYFAYGDEYGGLWNESLHIEGYNSTPPMRNPAPGLFSYKYSATGQSYSVTVPQATFAYGVHVKLAIQVLCP